MDVSQSTEEAGKLNDIANVIPEKIKKVSKDLRRWRSSDCVCSSISEFHSRKQRLTPGSRLDFNNQPIRLGIRNSANIQSFFFQVLDVGDFMA